MRAELIGKLARAHNGRKIDYLRKEEEMLRRLKQQHYPHRQPYLPLVLIRSPITVKEHTTVVDIQVGYEDLEGTSVVIVELAMLSSDSCALNATCLDV
jgi:hypothetical protein